MLKSVRLGVSTAAFFPKPLSETLFILRQLPWKYVEHMPQTPAECRPSFLEEIRAAGGGGLQFCAIHFPLILAPFLYNPYPGAQAFGQQLCEDLAALGTAFGGGVIIIHPPWKNMAEGEFLRATLSNLRRLCDAGAPGGVSIALENTPSSPSGASPQALLDFAAQIDRPNVGFTVDITHAYQMGQDPLDYIRGLPNILHVHASDFDLKTNQRHVLPGAGVVNWPEIVGALQEKDFSGNFILELLPETLGADPAAGLLESIALLDPLFAAAKHSTPAGKLE